MEVQLVVPEGTDISIVQDEYPDLWEDEGYGEGEQSYWCGSAMDDQPEGIEGEWMEYDECVAFCGFCEGAIPGAQTLMEGNGGWVQGMLSRRDFSGLAVSDEQKKYWKDRSDIYWEAFGRGTEKLQLMPGEL